MTFLLLNHQTPGTKLYNLVYYSAKERGLHSSLCFDINCSVPRQQFIYKFDYASLCIFPLIILLSIRNMN